jgi:hypothetical protein
MLIKTIIIFLGVMAIIGMVGRVLFPQKRIARQKPVVCTQCGRHVLGRGPCVCKG